MDSVLPNAKMRQNVAVDMAFPCSTCLIVSCDCQDSVRLVDVADAAEVEEDAGELRLHVSRGEDGCLRLRVTYGCQQQQQNHVEQQQQQQEQEQTDEQPKTALSELIVTERAYVRRLSLLFQHLYRGLQAAVSKRRFTCCTDDELKSVFGHFESMKVMHEQLLQELTAAEKAADGDRDAWRVGVIMIRYGHLLKSYSGYYSTFRLHTATVSRWLKDDAFRSVCRQLAAEWPDKVDSMLELTAHMLEPIQRPLRYPMLLRQYIDELGPDHADLADAMEALKVVEDTTNSFEKSVKDFNDFHQRLVMLRHITFPSSLSSYWEKMTLGCLLHCQVRDVTGGKDSPCYLLLCSSALLVCKAPRFKSQGNWTASSAIELTKEVRVEVNGLSLRAATSRKTWEFALPTEAEGRAWTEEMQRLRMTQLSNESADSDLLPWEMDAKGQQSLQQQQHQRGSRCDGCGCGFSAIAQMMSRRTCRVCSGLFCNDCLAYSYQKQQKRRCLFCKAVEDESALSQRHRELLCRFRSAREADKREAAGQLLVSAEWTGAPDWLANGWTAAWCRATSEGIGIFKRRRQFLPSVLLSSPKLLKPAAEDVDDDKAGNDEDAEEVELRVADAEGRECRLKGDRATTQRLLAALQIPDVRLRSRGENSDGRSTLESSMRSGCVEPDPIDDDEDAASSLAAKGDLVDGETLEVDLETSRVESQTLRLDSQTLRVDSQTSRVDSQTMEFGSEALDFGSETEEDVVETAEL